MRTLVLILLLAGCTRAAQIVTPDGHQGYAVSCNGSMNSTGSCYEKAGQMCPTGYNIHDGGSESRNFIVASGGGLAGGTATNRHLIISCRP